MKHVVQFSTGAGSAEVAYRVAAQHGIDDLVLLTADTKVEDADNWRFAREVVADLGLPLGRWVVLADGRTPMQVGRDHRAVPNNRMAICSRVLKRELSILRDRTGGTSTPLTLGAFRKRLESQPGLFDGDDWGACGCTDEEIA